MTTKTQHLDFKTVRTHAYSGGSASAMAAAGITYVQRRDDNQEREVHANGIHVDIRPWCLPRRLCVYRTGGTEGLCVEFGAHSDDVLWGRRLRRDADGQWRPYGPQTTDIPPRALKALDDSRARARCAA